MFSWSQRLRDDAWLRLLAVLMSLCRFRLSVFSQPNEAVASD